MKTINLNARIRVCLTPFGVECYHAYYKDLYSWYPANGHPMPTYPQLKDDYVFESELWDFMGIFGPQMYNGARPVTVGTDLEVVLPD